MTVPIGEAVPFSLIENRGQWSVSSDAGALRAVSTLHDGGRLFFFERGISLVHYGQRQQTAALPLPSELYDATLASPTTYRVDLRFRHAEHPQIAFAHPTALRRHYYLPSCPDGAIDIPSWRSIHYRDLYPGIDLHCTLEDDGLKYEFRLQPGADPAAIAMQWIGAGIPAFTGERGLLFRYVGGELRDAAPFVYQQDGDGALHPTESFWTVDDGVLGFAVTSWDRERPLIIDPFLQWSTFLGGSLSDYARDVALGQDGSMYLCGYSAGTDFPVTAGALQNASRGNFEVFISAFSRERKLLWSTYYGGSGSEENPQIAIGRDGRLYVAGSTSSTDLPVTPDALQPRNGGRYDVFLLALDAGGIRRWATYFGGSYTDECGDIAVAPDGTVCLAGATYSTNFPVTPDALQTSNAGDYDMFVARFSSGGAREWSSYIGGWSMDYASGIAIDDHGDLYLTGRTESTNLPAVSQGRQSSYGGGSFDAFVLRISAKNKKILWSTYLGGEEEDNGERIAIAADGGVVVAGYTASRHFPLTGNSLQKQRGGMIDAFLARLNDNGVLLWSTYMGGKEVEKATGLVVDVFGTIMVSGFTGSSDFPVTGASFQQEKGGGYDLFLSQFAADGGYIWGTFYGGETHDISYGLGTDTKGNAIVVGGTESRGFRTVGNIYQGDLAGLTDAFVLRVIFNEPLANAGRDTTICSGGQTFLGGRAAGGQPPYLFTWEPVALLSDARIERPLARPRESTKYILTVTDAEGAKARDTVTVTVAELPVVDAGKDEAVCAGATAVLRISVRGGRGPYQFRWEPTAGLNNPEAANPVAAPTTTTRYVVTVTDALGCIARDSVVVRVHPVLAVETGDDLVACANAPLPLQTEVSGGTPPFRFNWSPAAGLDDATSRTPVLTPRSSTRFVVTVTDANGCIALDTLTVTVHQPPQVDAGNVLSLCAGEAGKLSARVSGGKKPYSYSWSPRTGLSSATILTPEVRPEHTGYYQLTVTDANGCVVHDSVLVSVHPQPALQMAGDVDVCRNGSVQIGAEAIGGTPPYRYRWTPTAGLSNATIAMPLAAPARSTTYTVAVTDANGCSTGGTVRVSVKPRPDVRVSDRHRICSGASVELSASVRGGTPPYGFSWTPAVGLSAMDVANPMASPATSTSYVLRVTDAAGCVVEQKVDVDVLAPPIVEAGQDVTLCEGAPAALDARVAGGKPPYRALWTPSLGLNSVSRLDPTVRTTVSRSYRLTVTDANGCVATDSVTVSVAPPPVVNAGADVRLCEGTTTPLDATVSGGTPPYRYSWTPVNGLFDPQVARPTAQPERTTTYTLTVTDARGCSASDEVTVNVYPAPQIVASRQLTICRDQGRRIELSVRGGRAPYTYDWMPREGLTAGDIANPVVNPIQTTTYTVTVTDANGCRSSVTITVTVLPCNKADAGDDTELCLGDEYRLGPAAVDTMYGARYSWSPSVGLSSSTVAQPHARPRESTRYVLSKRNRHDCVSTDTVFVRVHPVPTVDAGTDLVLCPGDAGKLKASVKGGKPPYRFTWAPAAGLDRTDAAAVTARPAATTRYHIAVTDANGCVVNDSVEVRVAAPLRIAMEKNSTLCQGSTLRIGGKITGGTSPYTSFWSPATGLSDRTAPDPEASPTATTRYVLTTTDAVGCRRIDSVTVTVHPAPPSNIVADGATSICEGQRVRLSAPPGLTSYSWSNGKRERTIDVQEGGDYSVTVTDARGCTATSDPLTVTVAPLPHATITARGPLSFCEGDSVTLDAGQGFASYSWSTGATGRQITIREAGQYHVTVASTAGCSATSDPVSVEVRPAPVASFLRRLDTLIAYPAEQYQWLRDGRPISGATGRIYIAERSGRYALQTRNASNCSAESVPLTLSFAAAALALPRLTARKGDTIDIALRLGAASRMEEAGDGTLLAELALKKKTLRVISGGSIMSDQEEQRIRIPGSYRKGETTVAVLRAEVLADAGNIPLLLKSVRWLDGLVRTELHNGSLTVRE
ncbi:MAG: SBBP repeat-containing protein [Bacteroidetes bacterium]|nr:SBBP repeat-containing protein [Bacteroidota bacterium]